jgi:hypothetical protein
MLPSEFTGGRGSARIAVGGRHPKSSESVGRDSQVAEILSDAPIGGRLDEIIRLDDQGSAFSNSVAKADKVSART